MVRLGYRKGTFCLFQTFVWSWPRVLSTWNMYWLPKGKVWRTDPSRPFLHLVVFCFFGVFFAGGRGHTFIFQSIINTLGEKEAWPVFLGRDQLYLSYCLSSWLSAMKSFPSRLNHYTQKQPRKLSAKGSHLGAKWRRHLKITICTCCTFLSS